MQRVLALPVIEGVETLTLAGLDMLGHQLLRAIDIAKFDGLQKVAVRLPDDIELGSHVPLVAHAEDPNEQAGFIDDLENAGIGGFANQHGMKREVGINEALHLRFVEGRLAGLFELTLEGQDIVGQQPQSLEIGFLHLPPGHFTNGVHLQGFTKLVEVDDILAGQLYDHGAAVWSLLEEPLGHELAEGLAHGCPADPELTC